MPVAYRFPSGSLELVGDLATPPGRSPTGVPGLVLAHHFHTGAGGAAATAETYPELAERIATELGWYVLTFTCRGAGESEGQFSLGGWLEFAGGPAAALAASHLRSPATFTVQLDHLLSSVAVINHSRSENGAHFSRFWQKSWEILHCRHRRGSAG